MNTKNKEGKSIIIFLIVIAVVVGLAYFLISSNKSALAPSQNTTQPSNTLTDAERQQFLKDFQSSESASPSLSATEKAQLAKDFQGSGTSTPSPLTDAERQQLLNSLKQ